MSHGTGLERIRTVAFRFRVERLIPRSRQAWLPSLQTVYWRARRLVLFQLHASPEGYFVLVLSEAGFQTPALSAMRAQPREYGQQDPSLFPVQLGERVLMCSLVQQA